MFEPREVAESKESRVQGEFDLGRLLGGEYERQAVRDVDLNERVPDIGYNVLYRHGDVHEPIVDQWYLANGGRKPTWPNDADFAVCLTHDVDEVSKHSLPQFLRESARLARLRDDTAKFLTKRIAYFVDNLQSWGRESDAYERYERWLEVEESVGARSTFFFMPEDVSEIHETDSDYRFSDTVTFDGEECTVAEMMREMDRRGWEVGLHPTWNAYIDSDKLAQQKAQIERVLGHEVSSIRQHNLHHDITRTPRAQVKAGFQFDSTLGFNNGVGFRFGTSYPWQLYDLDADERLPLLELPLVVQDGALMNPRKGLSLDEDTAFDYVRQLTEAIEDVGGVFTLNWHPRFVSEKDWWDLYKRTLGYLDTKDVWFASMDEVGRWWLKHGFNYVW